MTTRRLAALALFCALALPLLAQAPAEIPDPLLAALQQELQRSRDKLLLEGAQKPYFIQYTVRDFEEHAAEVSLGAPTGRRQLRLRILTVIVRVGDYARDTDQGQVSDFLPTDDDGFALRHTLWLATDRAYKMALEGFTAKQTAIKQFESVLDVPDFSRQLPQRTLMPRVRLAADPAVWEALLLRATGMARDRDEIQEFEGRLQFNATNLYIVNTEGTAVRLARSTYQLLVAGKSQAADGTVLRRSYESAAKTPAELVSPEAFLAETSQQLATLKALREAPAVTDEYRGPVLFSEDAAASLLESVLAPNLLGRRPPLGNNARVTGAYANNLRTRVLPDFLSVIDDPTLERYGNTPLLGAYQIDDEAVPAKPVTLIENGILVNYLLARKPIQDFTVSNGHGRFYMLAVEPSPANLVLKASKTSTLAQLKAELIRLCRQQGLAYGYYVTRIAGARLPRLLYRVWVKDGREELVRGAMLDELDPRALRSEIIAAGDDPWVNNTATRLPVSFVAPSLLFREIVVKQNPEAKDKLPHYPPPALGAPGK